MVASPILHFSFLAENLACKIYAIRHPPEVLCAVKKWKYIAGVGGKVGGWWRGKRVGKWGKKICKHPSKDVCAYFSGCFSRVLLLRIHIQIYMYNVRIFYRRLESGNGNGKARKIREKFGWKTCNNFHSFCVQKEEVAGVEDRAICPCPWHDFSFNSGCGRISNSSGRHMLGSWRHVLAIRQGVRIPNCGHVSCVNLQLPTGSVAQDPQSPKR